MNSSKFFFLFLFGILLITSVNSKVEIVIPDVPTNYSTLNVNNSLYWNNNLWSDTRWLNIDGSNANQNIDIGNYLFEAFQLGVDNAILDSSGYEIIDLAMGTRTLNANNGFAMLDFTTMGTLDAMGNSFVTTGNVNASTFNGNWNGSSDYSKHEDGTASGQMAFWDGSKWVHTETSEMKWDDANKVFMPKEIRAVDANGLHIRNSAGTKGLFIKNNGKVGIGTTNPQYPLHLYSESDVTFLLQSSDSFSGFKLKDPSGEWTIATYQAGLRFRNTAGDDKVTFHNAGRVGIGLTNPSEKLEVNGNIKLTSDNDKLLLGTADDVSITYDGSKTIFTNEVGSGQFNFLGDINATGNITSTGTICDVNGCIGSGGGAGIWTNNSGTAEFEGNIDTTKEEWGIWSNDTCIVIGNTSMRSYC